MKTTPCVSRKDLLGCPSETMSATAVRPYTAGVPQAEAFPSGTIGVPTVPAPSYLRSAFPLAHRTQPSV